MSTAKRVKSKEFLTESESDSDEGPVKSKKLKKEKPKVEKVEADEKTEWELGKMKKVNFGEFKGTKYVSIREYYMDKGSGEERPGKKGITLNRSQWEEFMKIVQDVDAAFKSF